MTDNRLPTLRAALGFLQLPPRAPELRLCGRLPLLTELDAFFTDHRLCGDLDAGVDGPIVWIACPCGASMARRADGDERAAAG